MSKIAASYEAVPYASHAFAQSHPRRAATVARLQGLTAPAWRGCRVLELGCAAGGNLIPMALENATGEFLGLDVSNRSLADAKAAVEQLGLSNISFERTNLLDWKYKGPPFDYIVAHGLYSWVEPAVQARILEICRDHLSPNGVAYVSYNTLPGWSLRGAVRDFLRFGSRVDGPPVDQMRGARDLLGLLASALPPGRTPQSALVHNEVQRLTGLTDDYLFHEFLGETNSPLYFSDFVGQARRCDLQYVGEAEYSWMNSADLPPEIAESLRLRSRSVEEFEQYLDFVRWQLFRQTLLCHASRTLTRTTPPERIFPLWVAADIQVEGLREPLASGELVTFQRPKARMATPQPITKAALVVLAESWPRWWPFERLLRTALERIGYSGLERERLEALPFAAELAETLRRAYGISLIEMAVEPPPVAAVVVERPRVSEWALRQAQTSAIVTNQGHAAQALAGFQRFVLSLLDGQRDRAALLDVLEREASGSVALTDDQGRPISDRERIRQVLGQTLDRTLTELLRLGYLVAPEE
jgi:methyltransferase-like protein